MCKINPRVDFAFKKLFGSEENKDLLISLINAIIPEEEHVTELELKNPYNLADYQKGKMSILDIKAKEKTGRWINVEMQIGDDLYFDKRAIYYWSKLVTEQLSEGHMYKELQKTISINILGFNFVPDDSVYHNCYKIMNTRTREDDKLHDIFELYYIELKKFKKQFNEILSVVGIRPEIIGIYQVNPGVINRTIKKTLTEHKLDHNRLNLSTVLAEWTKKVSMSSRTGPYKKEYTELLMRMYLTWLSRII